MGCVAETIDPGLRRYKVYGIDLISDHHFYNYLKPALQGDVSPEVIFSRDSSLSETVDWQAGEQIYVSPFKSNTGESIAGIFRYGDKEVFRHRGIADYFLDPHNICCSPAPSITVPVWESYLFGTVFSYWLESQGWPVLHASAVSVDGGAVAFLAHSCHGKSTLAASFIKAGYPLISDDILPLAEEDGNFWCQPGLPQIKLWPDQAVYLAGRHVDLQPVAPGISKRMVPIGQDGFGAFVDRCQQLRCIYLPCRSNQAQGHPEIKILPLRLAEAVMELVRFTFIPNVTQCLGWQDRRLDFFARLVQQRGKKGRVRHRATVLQDELIFCPSRIEPER